MSKIYAIIIEDHHVEPDVRLFSDRGIAIAKAKELVKGRIGDWIENDPMEVPEYEFYERYGENDRIFVRELKIDEPDIIEIILNDRNVAGLLKYKEK